MAKEGSVAPRERVNIVYKPATGDAQEEVELPLKLLMIGDYTGRKDDRTVEDRKPINVDKDNFDEVLKSHNLEVQMSVADQLSGEKGAEMSVKLSFKKLSDFGPEAIVNQVPELKKLLELRGALTALKGPLGNVPAFRKKIQGLLGDETARKKLLDELGVKPGGGGGGGEGQKT
jgi:type VI secretion system protein ImpB